jgi:HB1/ASXL restriction endonuclease-like protein with HTH domain
MTSTKTTTEARTNARKAATKPGAPKAGAGKLAAAKPAAAKPKAQPRAGKALSGLDAAAKILADSDKPMTCGDVMARILELKLWASTGKTPAATLSAAIGREVKTKGKASRFKKLGRGLFGPGAPV